MNLINNIFHQLSILHNTLPHIAYDPDCLLLAVKNFHVFANYFTIAQVFGEFLHVNTMKAKAVNRERFSGMKVKSGIAKVFTANNKQYNYVMKLNIT